ncbi:MAG: cell division protein FtsQ/DivIB [Bdellovibrionales bacterium]
MGVSALTIFVIALWLWRIGWPQHQVERTRDALLRATADARFAVGDIVVEGRSQLDREQLLDVLGLSRGAPILDFNPAAARARILALPWVAEVRVERKLPDSVRVVLQERKPLARWQYSGRLSVIDEEGRELQEAKPEAFATLPLIVGAGAPEAAHDLFEALRNHPRVLELVTAATRVGERRWDLYLQSGVAVKLPEEGLSAALSRLSGIIEKKTLIEREVKVIDLRLTDRLIIQSDVPVTTDSFPPSQTGENRP